MAVVRRARYRDDVHGARQDLRGAHEQAGARQDRHRSRPARRRDAGAPARQVLPPRIPRHRLDGTQRRRAVDCGRRFRAYRFDRGPHAARAGAVRPAAKRRTRMDQGILLLVLVIAAVAFVVLLKTAIVVPQQSAYVVERLGKYSSTLHAGFHILVPFIERIAYRHSLKEDALDIAEQICITKDNVQVGIDGVLYLQVLDPARASYGIANYHFAISQLAQTTLRSEIGKIDLDRTFEERATINANVVTELDKASEPWGVKVLRYEIRNINPPADVLQAMEKQMRAERE